VGAFGKFATRNGATHTTSCPGGNCSAIP
jgi:hypothetical protein